MAFALAAAKPEPTRKSVPVPTRRSARGENSLRTGKSMSVTIPSFHALHAGACCRAPPASPPPAFAGHQAQAAKDLVVGFIYVGPKDDYGYNQAHAEAAAMLKKMPGVKIVEEEKVPETDDVSKTMESMIKLDGATLLFPTSFGYFDPYMLKMAAKYKDIQFRHCGGLWQKDKHPMNTGSYFGYIGMCQYLNGIAAAHATKIQEDRLHRRQADPAGADQRQQLRPRRPLGRSHHHHIRHLHRRMVDAGQGSRGHQQPDRPGHRRRHLPRRRPEGDHGNRRTPRHLHLWLPRRPVQAGAQGLPDRRRVELDHRLQAVRRRCPGRQADPQLHPRRPRRRLRQDVRLRTRAARRRPQERRLR